MGAQQNILLVIERNGAPLRHWGCWSLQKVEEQARRGRGTILTMKCGPFASGQKRFMSGLVHIFWIRSKNSKYVNRWRNFRTPNSYTILSDDLDIMFHAHFPICGHWRKVLRIMKVWDWFSEITYSQVAIHVPLRTTPGTLLSFLLFPFLSIPGFRVSALGKVCIVFSHLGASETPIWAEAHALCSWGKFVWTEWYLFHPHCFNSWQKCAYGLGHQWPKHKREIAYILCLKTADKNIV